MLLRLCRVALAVIAISVLYWIFSNGAGYYLRSPWEMFAMSCYALEAAALAASPGPRRGLRLLLTWRAAWRWPSPRRPPGSCGS